MTHAGRARASWTAAGATIGAVTVVGAWIAAGADNLASLVWVHRAWPPMLVLDGLPLGLGAVGLLVARVREVEAALARVQRSLGPFGDGGVAANLDQAALLVDPDGRVVAANPAARELLGEAVVSTPLGALIPDLASARPIGSDPTSVRATATLPDGTARAIRATCAPMPGPRILVLLREEADEQPGEASPVLAGLTLGLAATLSAGALDRPHPDTIGATAAAVDRAIRVTRISSPGSRRGARARRQPEAPVESDLRPVVERAVIAAVAAARESGATLAVGGGPCLATADPVRVEWALTALLCDACTRSGDGLVRLTVRTGGGRRPRATTELVLRASSPPSQLEPLVTFSARWLAEQEGGLSLLPTPRGNQLVLRLPGVGAPPGSTQLEVPGPIAIVGQAPAERAPFTAAASAPWVSWPAPDLDAVLAEDPRAVVLDLGSESRDDTAAPELWAVFRALLDQPVLEGRPLLVALGAEVSAGATLPDGVAGALVSPLDPLALGEAVRAAERGMRRCSVVGPPGRADELRDALAVAGYPVGRFWTLADAAGDGAAARVIVDLASEGDADAVPQLLVGAAAPARASDLAVPALGRPDTIVELVDGLLGVLDAD
jgi:PAS domain-containing protein